MSLFRKLGLKEECRPMRYTFSSCSLSLIDFYSCCSLPCPFGSKHTDFQAVSHMHPPLDNLVDSNLPALYSLFHIIYYLQICLVIVFIFSLPIFLNHSVRSACAVIFQNSDWHGRHSVNMCSVNEFLKCLTLIALRLTEYSDSLILQIFLWTCYLLGIFR